MDRKGSHNAFVWISTIAAIITVIIAYLQYKENKELRAIEKKLKQHELDQIKHLS